MNRADIKEFHYIAPIVNVPSIVQHGILSHRLASKTAHNSVAMREIQERRKNKQIPGARRLHEYANVYLDAHNPMLSKVRGRNYEICILRIDQAIMDLPGVIIADCNAASDWARFYPVADGIKAINRDRVYAQYWTHPKDLYDELRHKSEKCAEVLVPDNIMPCYIIGAYVASEEALKRFQQLNIELPVCINHGIFF
jgi:hypothetical protein